MVLLHYFIVNILNKCDIHYMLLLATVHFCSIICNVTNIGLSFDIRWNKFLSKLVFIIKIKAGFYGLTLGLFGDISIESSFVTFVFSM